MTADDREHQKMEDRIGVLEKGQQEILDLLKPIARTYASVETIGKWGMAFLVIIATLIGIFAGIKNIK
jgi:hypothetical protein